MRQETPEQPQCWATFDCYGTLIDWKEGMRQALEAVIPGNAERLLKDFYQVQNEVEAEQPFRTYRNVLAEALWRTAERTGIALVPGAENVLAETLPNWPVFSDVGPALEALRATGWKLAILSNVDRDLILGTRRVLPVPFDAVVTAEDVQTYKPSLNHFHYFRERNQVAQEDWVHVAHSYFHDIIPASQLGIKHVWVNRNGDTTSALPGTVMLSDLGNLAITLQQLRREHF